VYHTTKQCEEDASYKYSVDDGDSEMLLCGGCFRRCLTKKKNGSSWLGFFDCSYPPEAKVKGSSWYYWMMSNAPSDDAEGSEDELCEDMAKCSLSESVAQVEKAEDDAEAEDAHADAEAEEAHADAEAEEAQVEAEAEEAQVEAEAQVEEVEAEEAEAEAQVEEVEESAADKIKSRIAYLQAFVKSSRGMPVKEQAKILKEIINLRTELKKIC
jgi:hypothetical protein